MADKKVERSGRERPITPTQKMEAALSDPGTMNVSQSTHDKGRSALVDKYREREERWRREQSLQAQRSSQGLEAAGGAESERQDEEAKLEDLLRAEPSAEGQPRTKGGRAKGGAL
jgi:hypothetical protein